MEPHPPAFQASERFAFLAAHLIFAALAGFLLVARMVPAVIGGMVVYFAIVAVDKQLRRRLSHGRARPLATALVAGLVLAIFGGAIFAAILFSRGGPTNIGMLTEKLATEPIRTEKASTRVKVKPSRMAIDAGMTMIAETNKAPATGIIKAIATPVTTLNKTDIVLTGKPSTKAVSSSKVMTYIGRINKTKTTKTTAASIASKITCVCETVTIEPNRYWSRLMPLPLPALEKIKAKDRPRLIRIAVATSKKLR